MKFSGLIFLPLVLVLYALQACSEPEDFTAEELRDLTPIMQFKGNPIPEKCYSESHITYRNGDAPYWRMYCHFYFKHYEDFYDAVEAMGWEYEKNEGDDGDCGPKHEYKQTVGDRQLHLYVKTCSSSMFVSDDRFLFHVEYYEDKLTEWLNAIRSDDE